ncbi:SLBB domain-containing protein [bacterium]|nr:SLBB domain-containing protein [bacterium]
MTSFAVLMTAALLMGQVGAGGYSTPAHLAGGLEMPLVAPTRVVDVPIDRTEYVVGPGDGLLLTLRGEMNEAERLTVSPEGDLIIPTVGSLRVVGFTIEEAEGELRRFFDAFYHDFELSLNRVSPRDVVVHVTGAVLRPGQYEATAAMRVSAVVELAGGVLEDGSQRAVSILSPNGIPRQVDLLSYALLGDLHANPLIMEGAVVHVSYRRRSIEIRGAVNQPGEYELVDSDDVGDMLRLAGGVTPDAELANVELVRFSAADPRVYTRSILDLSAAVDGGTEACAAAAVALADGDRILVHRIEGWHRDARVEVRGEVNLPGIYSINEGKESVSDIVARAGGPTDAADLARSTLRRRAAGGIESGAERQVELLEAYEPAQMTYEEYAFLISQRLELPDQMSIDLKSLLRHESDAADVLLLDGDIVEIPRFLSVVRVSGAISRPGFVKFEPGASARNYIALAGGFTSDANRSGLRIVKSQSGSRLRASRGVRIEPGDMVWVPRKPDRDWWEITKEVLGVVGQVATVYLVIDSIAKQ